MNQKDFKNKSEMQIFLSYFKPHRKLFLLDMVCALAIALIDLAFPYFQMVYVQTFAGQCVENILDSNGGCVLRLYFAVSFYLYYHLLGAYIWRADRNRFPA